MRNSLQVAFATIVAIVVMGASTTAAFADGIRTSTSSTVETAVPITLRDSSLGNVIGSIAITMTLSASVTCPRTGTLLLQLGGATRASFTITSPAGYTATVPLFLKYYRCINGNLQRDFNGNPVVHRLFSFGIRAGFLGTYSYTGTMEGVLGASPATRETGISSSFTSDRGTTASFVTPWSFSLSPSIVWATI